jgi:hypothetical protein
MKGKKIIVLLVVSFILINVVSLSAIASISSPATVYGDSDNDGNFDSDDYSLFRQFLLGMKGIDRISASADVDGNGQYDSDDYAYMRQHLLGMINIFPAESSVAPSPTNTSYVTQTITPTPTSTPVPTSKDKVLYISSSKESADMLKVTLYIKNIDNFSGYQANLVYDPQVLKPVYSDGSEYDSQSPVYAGNLLTKNYAPVDFAKHDLQNGVLNFGRTYMAVNSYKDSGVSESSGSIAIICFKILKYETTQIRFENCEAMPGSINGTIITDWDGNQDLNYNVDERFTISPYMLTDTPAAPSTPASTVTVPATSDPYDWYDWYYGYW